MQGITGKVLIGQYNIHMLCGRVLITQALHKCHAVLKDA